MRDMIHHQDQAVQMAELVKERATGSRQVKLARVIAAIAAKLS